jgi:hypothetical protein
MRFKGLKARSGGLYVRARQIMPGETASLAALAVRAAAARRKVRRA